MEKCFYWIALTFIIMCTVIVSSVSLHYIQNSPSYILASPQPRGNITMTIMFNTFQTSGKSLVENAADILRSNHPDLGINIKYSATEYNKTRYQMLNAISNGTSVDIITLDQIWLGEFAQKGFLTDLSNYTKKWGHLSDWYQANLDGMTYNGSTYGIWAWTDVRGIWYWKDLLNKAGVDPNSLETWNGYIAAAKKLNTVLRPQGIEGVHLTGASHSPDLWYPYLWMLKGDIIAQKPGHPTKGDYWFPIYNNSKGVRALEFIKAQIDPGVKPQKEHYFGKEFADKKFAVMLEGSWLPSDLPKVEIGNVQFIPMFPVPSLDNKTSALMGGWEFSIPSTSSNKNLAWELIEIMLQPQVLSPWLAQQGNLPTQISLGEGNGSYANLLRKSIPFYDEMISMIPMGKVRPNIPEYPAIAEDIRQALDDVYYGIKDLSINKTDSILKVDKLHTEGPLDYMFTNFEYTNVITESVICGDMYYMVR